MDNPDFELMRAAMDGFKPETVKRNGHVKPTQANIKALSRLITPDAETIRYRSLTSWPAVVEHMYRQLAWFRKYYCGEDLPDLICRGALGSFGYDGRDNVLTENKWHLEAKRLKEFADG